MQPLIAPAEQEQRIPMSYAEFLTAFAETTHAEWVNGEAIVFMPPTIRHQDIVAFLVALLRAYVDYFRLGKVLAAPCEMRALPEGNAREPDLFFVAQANLPRLTETRLAGPADLVIEVVSDESLSRDRADKFYEYQQAGVREYWIIDPRPGTARADFWVLDEQGRYRPTPADVDGIYRAAVVPRFWLDVAWLWQEELPDPIRVFVQITGLRIGE